ncbi:MAG: glycosyltransferase family 39 protein [bacterium]
MRRKKCEILILLSILLIAGIFRFYQITSYPAGLFPDQAANGLDVEELILQGRHSVFFERGNGREGLFFYLIAGIFKIFGPGVWQIFLSSAIVGFLAILIFYFLIKNWFDWKIASLASFFYAVSLPATVMSRNGFRAILITLTASLFFLFLTKAHKNKNLIYSILTGFFLSLNLYTYVSARILVLAFVALILILLRHELKKILVIGASALLTFLPLAIYFIKHPEFLLERAGHVSVFNPDLNQGSVFKILILNIKKTFLMFFTQGDLNWRHNTSGEPFFDIFTAGLFVLGIMFLIYRLRKDFFVNFSIFTWFFAGLAPMALTAEAIPHFLRAQGIIPIIFIFPAIGLWWICNLFKNKILLGLFGIGLIFVLVFNFYQYFVYAKNQHENNYAFRADLTKTAKLINERDNQEKTFLVLDDYSVQTIDFLTYRQGQKFILVKPELVNEREYPADSLVIFTESTEYDFTRFNKHNNKILIKWQY